MEAITFLFNAADLTAPNYFGIQYAKNVCDTAVFIVGWVQ